MRAEFSKTHDIVPSGGLPQRHVERGGEAVVAIRELARAGSEAETFLKRSRCLT